MRKLGNHIQKILAANPEEFSVKLRFTNGVSGKVSLEMFFDQPKGLAAEILKGDMFDKCFVESGALAWPNGFELCPDVLRTMLSEQQKKHVA